MTDRPRQPLAFGGGVDRSSGPLVVQPTSFKDLRNVTLSEGWMSVRRGLAPLIALADFVAADAVVGAAVTHVIGVEALRSQGVNIVITYDATLGECAAWILAGTLSSLTLIDTFWPGIAGPAQIPPIVSMADSYDKMFVAHDEPLFAARQKTQVVDVGAVTVTTLNGGVALGDFKFRGVARFINYLFGWGHGTAGEPDHPEIVRQSIAADPLTWDPDHYVIAGQRGDPVLSCGVSGKMVKARKQTETYDITGFSPDTFAVTPGDLAFGIAGSQLSVRVGTKNYFWSLEGPRVDAGPGESTDLATLLGLSGPVPDALAAALDFTRGFAVYQPVTREVRFVFGAWAFVLHLYDETRKRWSFAEYGVPLATGGLVFQAQAELAPEAHLEMSDTEVTDTTIDQTADVVGPLLGGEVAEWWLLDPNILVWSLYATVPVGLLDATSENLYAALLPGLGYLMAVRLKRNGLAGAGYTNPNPNTWPATARKTAVTLEEPGGPVDPGSPASEVEVSDFTHDSTSVTMRAHALGTLDGTESIEWYNVLPVEDTVPSLAVTPAPIAADEDWLFGGLVPSTSYVFAARLLRGGVPTTPYAGPLYSWPATSFLSVTTDP